MPDGPSPPSTGLQAAADRLSRSRRGRAALLALLVLPVVLIDGLRTVDADLPAYLGALARGDGEAAPALRGFLLEGLLPDAIGVALVRAGVGPDLLPLAWWSLGVALLGAVLALALRRGELSFRDVLLLVAFSHLTDTLALWIGKFDPLLMACLVLSAWRRPGPAVAGSALAGFCHPILAALSTLGVVAVDFALGRGVRRLQAAVGLAAAAADLALAHRIVPGLVDRAGYFGGLVAGLLHDAALLGLPALVSAGLAPALLARCVAGPFRYGGRRGAALLATWAALALLVGCVLTLDHTRVITLLTLAPAVAFLRAQGRGPRAERWDWTLFALLFLCRLGLPQIDGNGAVAATPYPLAPWIEP